MQIVTHIHTHSQLREIRVPVPAGTDGIFGKIQIRSIHPRHRGAMNNLPSRSQLPVASASSMFTRNTKIRNKKLNKYPLEQIEIS
eukprot:scaffold107107_cov14-Prasinocladus_malaysianus.AAC.1